MVFRSCLKVVVIIPVIHLQVDPKIFVVHQSCSLSISPSPELVRNYNVGNVVQLLVFEVWVVG